MTFDIKELDRAYGRVQLRKQYFPTPQAFASWAVFQTSSGLETSKNQMTKHPVAHGKSVPSQLPAKQFHGWLAVLKGNGKTRAVLQVGRFLRAVCRSL